MIPVQPVKSAMEAEVSIPLVFGSTLCSKRFYPNRSLHEILEIFKAALRLWLLLTANFIYLKKLYFEAQVPPLLVGNIVIVITIIAAPWKS